MSRDEVLISEVIPTVEALKKYLREINAPGAGTLRGQLEQGILKRFGTIKENKCFALATSLDPKYKFAVFDEEGRNEIKTDVLSECQRNNQKNSEDRTESNDETPIVIGDEINLESDEEAPLVEDVISRKPSPNLWKCLEDIKSASGSDNTGMNEDSALLTSVSQEIEAYVKIPYLTRRKTLLHGGVITKLFFLPFLD
ncbi:hypothetical protein HHI36_012168 [Cryptolaemus montrouzieri]|uniref:Uncharacterized protein n=1 Tax=Cryptolaemus montrouzieri TaxID=559131 RepID=A0ABD2NE75_9CUCU